MASAGSLVNRFSGTKKLPTWLRVESGLASVASGQVTIAEVSTAADASAIRRLRGRYEVVRDMGAVASVSRVLVDPGADANRTDFVRSTAG
jgi:hypothetical protein